jgi:CheY-like chemotaxis protein
MALRVLVVDDDAGIRETLARLLRAKGCEVSTATDGSDALRILRGEQPKPNAIVLDLMMPVMGGWEFLEAKADDATIRAIPVFVTTAHAQMAVELKHVVGIFRKPDGIPKLIAAVEQMIAAAEQAPPAPDGDGSA